MSAPFQRKASPPTRGRTAGGALPAVRRSVPIAYQGPPCVTRRRRPTRPSSVMQRRRGSDHDNKLLPSASSLFVARSRLSDDAAQLTACSSAFAHETTPSILKCPPSLWCSSGVEAVEQRHYIAQPQLFRRLTGPQTCRLPRRRQCSVLFGAGGEGCQCSRLHSPSLHSHRRFNCRCPAMMPPWGRASSPPPGLRTGSEVCRRRV